MNEWSEEKRKDFISNQTFKQNNEQWNSIEPCAGVNHISSMCTQQQHVKISCKYQHLLLRLCHDESSSVSHDINFNHFSKRQSYKRKPRVRRKRWTTASRKKLNQTANSSTGNIQSIYQTKTYILTRWVGSLERNCGNVRRIFCAEFGLCGNFNQSEVTNWFVFAWRLHSQRNSKEDRDIKSLLDKPCSFFFCEVDIRIKGNTIH